MLLEMDGERNGDFLLIDEYLLIILDNIVFELLPRSNSFKFDAPASYQ